MSILTLSTMTFDGKLSNISFKKETAIYNLFTDKNIIKIGCNYGIKESEEYKLRFEKKPKSNNRGRKPKKIHDKHKKQGDGSHFNSQITFTILYNDKVYQVKLFTNGRIQIPGIGKDSDIEKSTTSILNMLIAYINMNKSLKFKINEPIQLERYAPILQNYKSIVIEDLNALIDLRLVKNIMDIYRIDRNTDIKIESVTFNPERYAGLLVKFSTPLVYTSSRKVDKFIELVRMYYFKKAVKPKLKSLFIKYPDPNSRIEQIFNLIIQKWVENNKVKKRFKCNYTTVKIFKSSKINIDNATSEQEAEQIKNIIVDIIMLNINKVRYFT